MQVATLINAVETWCKSGEKAQANRELCGNDFAVYCIGLGVVEYGNPVLPESPERDGQRQPVAMSTMHALNVPYGVACRYLASWYGLPSNSNEYRLIGRKLRAIYGPAKPRSIAIKTGDHFSAWWARVQLEINPNWQHPANGRPVVRRPNETKIEATWQVKAALASAGVAAMVSEQQLEKLATIGANEYIAAEARSKLAQQELQYKAIRAELQIADGDDIATLAIVHRRATLSGGAYCEECMIPLTPGNYRVVLTLASGLRAWCKKCRKKQQ